MSPSSVIYCFLALWSGCYNRRVFLFVFIDVTSLYYGAMSYPNNEFHADQLACERGNRQLFAGVSFQLSPGSLLRIKGSNGSGKTTLLRALCGLVRPTEGSVLWNGVSIEKADGDYHQQMLYLGHAAGIKPDLTVLENLRYFSVLDRCEKTVDLAACLERIGLKGLAHRRCSVLSAGQKRRVLLARLVSAPVPLWLLDEPLTALDVAGVDLLLALMGEHLKSNGMIVMTSHQDFEIEGVDRATLTVGR